MLDKLLVDAAAEAGAQVREGFTIEDILVEDGCVVGVRGRGQGEESVTEYAKVVIGADGLHSLLARTVRPQQYHTKPQLLCGYYSYWTGLPMHGRFETYIRPDRGFAAAPTHDDLTLVIAGWPYSEFTANKSDLERHYLAAFDLAPHFGERVRNAKRETRIVGSAVPNYFRKPYGAGWAMIGDAGYNKDFITAQGITDAFLDAERCTTALDEAFTGARTYDAAMAGYHSARDERALPMYELTTQNATLQPAPPELQQVLGAIRDNQQEMDAFVRVNAGVTRRPSSSPNRTSGASSRWPADERQ